MGPRPLALVRECLESDNGQQLMKMEKLTNLKRLVERRTGTHCSRTQYRTREGLVEYLMEWFPTSQELLNAVRFALFFGTLPLDFRDRATDAGSDHDYDYFGDYVDDFWQSCGL